MDIREILVDWSMASGGGKRSVMFFDAAISVAVQRDAINDWLQTVTPFLDASVQYTIESSGRELDDATGTLQSMWAEGTVYTDGGEASGEQVADATQILIRWLTDTVVDGRLIHGRTFIPGMAGGHLSNGNLLATSQVTLRNNAAAFLGASVGFGIWHRPRPASTEHPVARAGAFVEATTADVWGELAVLRRRRN